MEWRIGDEICTVQHFRTPGEGIKNLRSRRYDGCVVIPAGGGSNEEHIFKGGHLDAEKIAVAGIAEARQGQPHCPETRRRYCHGSYVEGHPNRNPKKHREEGRGSL